MTTFDCLWSPAPPDLVLPDEDIHVLCASLDQPAFSLSQLAETLSPDERERSEKFYFERDRNRYIAGRGILRKILGYYLHVEPNLLQFHYGVRGKPALAEPTGTLRFNLSHSQGLALYALARDRELGIDLEFLRPISDAEQIAEHFFSALENRMFCALPAEKRQEAFYNCWTRKEAYINATGDGLSRPLDQFDVSLYPGEPARLLNVEGDRQEAARWTLQELAPASGYLGALAAEGQGLRLCCWQ